MFEPGGSVTDLIFPRLVLTSSRKEQRVSHLLAYTLAGEHIFGRFLLFFLFSLHLIVFLCT